MNNYNNARRRRNIVGGELNEEIIGEITSEEIIKQPTRTFMNRVRTVKNSAVGFARILQDLTVGQIKDLLGDQTPANNVTIGNLRSLALFGFTAALMQVAAGKMQGDQINTLTEKIMEAQRGAPPLGASTGAFMKSLITNMIRKGGRRTIKKDRRRRRK